MNVEAIKEAIGELSEEDRLSLASWIVEHEYDEWDRQMVKDFSPGGRGSHLVEKINRQIDEGKGFRERQNRP